MFGKFFRKKIQFDDLTVSRRFEMFSRTATVVVFDLACLSHRVNDDVDWWSDPESEVAELHARNLVIAGLNANDWYDVSVDGEITDGALAYSLRVISGRLFIGPGEEISGGGSEPTGQHGGIILMVKPGDYSVSFERADSEVLIHLKAAAAFSNDEYGPILI